MRYDLTLIPKGRLEPEPYSATPGEPALLRPRVVVADRSHVDQEIEGLTDTGNTDDPPFPDGDYLEDDSVMPLFPEDAQYDDPNYRPTDSPPPLRGKVRLRLAEVAEKRGLILRSGRFAGQPNLSAIQRGTGLAYATVFKLLRKPEDLTGISFDVLSRLCEYLHCQPGDLLVWEPRADQPQTLISDYFKRQGGSPE